MKPEQDAQSFIDTFTRATPARREYVGRLLNQACDKLVQECGGSRFASMLAISDVEMLARAAALSRHRYVFEPHRETKGAYACAYMIILDQLGSFEEGSRAKEVAEFAGFLLRRDDNPPVPV